MDAAQALADLTEISSQVAQVAILDRDGSILAATAGDGPRAERFVASVRRLLDEVEQLAQARGLGELSQLEVSTLDGSVFAVRRDGRLIVATTRPDPTVGLIFYDLKHCLGAIDDSPAVPEGHVQGTVPQTWPSEPAPDDEESSGTGAYETVQVPRVRRDPPA